MAQAQAQHEALLSQYRTLIGKTVLVGIQGVGISTTNVTAVIGEFPPAIAIALSTDKNAGENGQFYDARQVVFYKSYSEEEAAKLAEQYAKEQGIQLKVVPNATQP